MKSDNRKDIVVFASGSGTNFMNIHRNVKHGIIKLLISNNSKCGAIIYAKKNSIPFKIINDFRYPLRDDKDKEYESTLGDIEPDLILLAGFMKKIPEKIVSLYRYKIMNIHPSLLPKFGGEGFYGIKVHEAVISSREKTTGATVHFVNEYYDQGSIILQSIINVDKNDTVDSISKKVLEIEYRIYLKAVNLFCNNKISINNNKVIIHG